MGANGTAAWTDTEAGHQLQERLNSEKTLQALDHLLERIETMETAVDRLATALEQGPGLVSMAADITDDAMQQVRSRGVDPAERLENALHIAEKLTAPEMVEKLDKFIAMTDQVPGLMSMMGDIVDDGCCQAADNGIDIPARLSAVTELVEKVTRPDTINKLNQLIELSEKLPGLASMGVDMLDEGYQRAAERGVDWTTLNEHGLEMLTALTKLLTSDEFKALMQSGVLDPCTIKVVAKAGEAMVDSNREPVKPAGIWSMLTGMADKDRQRALGFLLSFSKHFGKRF